MQTAKKGLVIAMLMAAGLAGCTQALTPASSEPDSASAYGTLDQAELSFDGHRVSGTGGCNRIFGPARVEQGRLIVGSLASTRMACPAHEAGDQALIDFLESRPRLIQGAGDEWRLEGASQQMAIERVPMQ